MREMLPLRAVAGKAITGLPNLARAAPADEIHLPAKAAIKTLAHRIGAHLPREIDLQAPS